MFGSLSDSVLSDGGLAVSEVSGELSDLQFSEC